MGNKTADSAVPSKIYFPYNMAFGFPTRKPLCAGIIPHRLAGEKGIFVAQEHTYGKYCRVGQELHIQLVMCLHSQALREVNLN